MAETRLIVGLGNPEARYQHTRHNYGFLVVEALAEQWNVAFRTDRFVQGRVAKYEDRESTAVLLLPNTYMNLSGVALSALVKKRNIALEHILVVCDDLDLSFAEIRLRAKGSAGGHNGLKSIIEHLGSSEFARLRCGIGRGGQKQKAVDFVLDDFSRDEMKKLPDVITAAAACCQSWMTQGINEAMSQFNKRKNDE